MTLWTASYTESRRTMILQLEPLMPLNSLPIPLLLRLTGAALLLACLPTTEWSYAQSEPGNSPSELPTVLWPEGISWNRAIPTPQEHFGFDIGQRHLSHAQVASYLQRLATASDRVSIRQYAQSHGHRPLLMLMITAPENQTRLAEIRKAHVQLTSSAGDQVDLETLPAVINMGYGVHGDESSATNCAPLVAYYLAAAEGAEIVDWLRHCVILLDPSLNPDGFNRFANWANRYRGAVLNPDPAHAEHQQMWPPGRVNYYWFDLNRDWLPAVHPESRGRLSTYHRWKPNVVLDFHEMGTNSTFFFQPGIPERTNPLTPARNQELTRRFASYHARELDQQGRLYFTKERFDDFYVGKGSTYPDLHGSVGILFEQASSRGHVQTNQDGLLRFVDTISNQFTTSLTSLRATTAMRLELHRYKRDFYQQAREAAATAEHQAYLFQVADNPTRLVEFGDLLRRHDIQSYWLKEDLVLEDKSYSASSTLVVPADQSEYRFLRSLLMRRTNFRENVFYDVSSWTLPLAYGLRQHNLKAPLPKDALLPWSEQDRFQREAVAEDARTIAYLIDYRDDSTVRLLCRLLHAGVNVRIAKRPFSLPTDRGIEEFPRGTLAVILGVQPQRRTQIERILGQTTLGSRAQVTPVKQGLSAQGPDLGSSNFAVIKPPRIAMLTGSVVSTYTAGAAWHGLDRKAGLPVTLLKESRLRRTNLDPYTTLILPDGSLDEDQWSAVEAFASQGGTVVALGRIAVTAQQRLRGNESDLSRPLPAEDESIQKPFDSAAKERALALISGAIFKTQADLTHPLLFGLSHPTMAVFRNHSQMLRPSKSAYRNPLVYAPEPLLAGYCSAENRERLSGAACVVVEPAGRGRWILISDDPNFRGFWKSTYRVFINAVLLGELVDS